MNYGRKPREKTQRLRDNFIQKPSDQVAEPGSFCYEVTVLTSMQPAIMKCMTPLSLSFLSNNEHGILKYYKKIFNLPGTMIKSPTKDFFLLP